MIKLIKSWLRKIKMYDYLSASYSICINSKKNMQEDMAGFEEYLKELLTTNKILSDRNIELSCMIQRFKDTGQWEDLYV